MKTNYNSIREREEAAQTLLAAYRQGDQNAFMSLYDMYAEMLLNYGLCITSDKELVKIVYKMCLSNSSLKARICKLQR